MKKININIKVTEKEWADFKIKCLVLDQFVNQRVSMLIKEDLKE